MIARIQVRRDTYANWTSNNPILTNGEIGYDETNEKFKVGDNTTAWNDLPYELGQWKSDTSGNLSYGSPTQSGTEGNVTVHNNLTVEGNFTVNGTTTTINTEEVTIEDNMVVLNSNLTGAPPSSLDSGIEVNLGTSGSQKFYWDQATSKWTLDADVNVLGDIYSNGIALWRLNGNDIYFTGGDVGIGTNSPATLLHLKDISPANENTCIRLENDAQSWDLCNRGGDSDKFKLVDVTANTSPFIVEKASPTSSLYVKSDGNVGINTATPSEKLEVLGNIKATNNISSATTKTYQITSNNGTDEYYYIGKLQHNNGSDGYANIVVYNHVDYGLHQNTRLEVQISQRSGTFVGNALLYGDRVTGENVDILCYEDSASQNIFIYAKIDSFGLSIIEVTHMGGSDYQISQNTEGTTVPTSSGARVDGGSEIFNSADNIDFMVSKDGNVGIGTTSPNGNLHIHTTGDGSTKLQITDGISGSGTHDGLVIGMDADQNAYFWQQENTGIKFGTNNSEVVRILANGNVGIGTTSPNAKLQIDVGAYDANDKISGLSVGRTIANTGYATAAIGYDVSTSGNYAIGMGHTIVASGYNSFAQGHATTATGSQSIAMGREMIVSGDNSFGIGLNNPASEHTLAQDNTFSIMGGNVGIGTVTPSKELEVSGDLNATNIYEGGTAISTKYALATSIKDSQVSINFQNGLGLAGNNVNATFTLNDSSAYAYVVQNLDKGSDQNIFKNVAVSGQNPIVADSNNDTLTFVAGTGITLTTDDSNDALTITSSASSSQWTTTGNDIYYNTGDVGIGNTNPSAKLDVSGEINFSGATTSFVSSLSQPRIYRSGSSAGSYPFDDFGHLILQPRTDGSNRDIVFATGTNGANLTVIDSSGKVGIGTSDPDDLIHVSDTSAGSNPGIRIENDAQEWVIYNRGSSSDRFQIFDVDNSKSPFRILPNSPTNAISINATGVGMGKESASEVLDVVGNITATGTITSSSDITLKENIELISDPIEKVKELSGYTFNKKGEDLRLVGLIAQEVEKVLPEAVLENNEGLKSVAYGNLVALLVECVKKQDERIDHLEKIIEKLK